MTSAITKAMIESYALMAMVMGTFFVYFCGMVWAFCNPKLNSEEEESGFGNPTSRAGDHVCLRAPDAWHRDPRSACAHPRTPPCTLHAHAQAPYVNFYEDTYSLLSDCASFYREDPGIDMTVDRAFVVV